METQKLNTLTVFTQLEDRIFS